ncbi:MAG TPA: methyltransferase domain-containing protein [Methylomusa anaerophila]|uniref:Malonyl-[acyl-carrier protein] O-methyltransferase n=1 Tax=Methylomusa anaerophila TaxID=1930071 RepID=A0A348AEE8_9FIRM|nr:class I SAM-dependent methyltransferase [Methylomusa anaerophila]BBB89446.1 malonyl-[acyl-carrier protein] O-methyltransferase [Methylomusa anaerophila]HML89679.1 methyltransferase domain-containing protein [Methylomusa anaerophila]
MIKYISQYWTDISSIYKKCVDAQFKNNRSIRLWENLLSNGIGEQPQQKILDAGTGPGFCATLLAQKGHLLTAVDVAPGMVEIARDNFLKNKVFVNLYCGDVANLEREASGTFDAVVSRDVVWTLPSPQAAYNEWWRVLKPGGRLVVFDGNFLNNQYQLLRPLWKKLSWILVLLSEKRNPTVNGMPEEMICNLPYISVLRPPEDKKLLEAIGFKIIEIKEKVFEPDWFYMEYLKYGHMSTKFMIVAEKS